jgi:hypothetical protein
LGTEVETLKADNIALKADNLTLEGRLNRVEEENLVFRKAIDGVGALI